MANTKVQSEQIEDGSITADKLADGTIVAAELANNAVVTAAINADAVTGAKIADNAIDSEHYTDGSIDTAHIADSQITVGKMAANSVDSDQYVDGSIDTVHIADLQVTTAKIANGNISTAKIADNAVTSAKIDTNIDIAGTFDVTGATTLDSTLSVAGISTLNVSAVIKSAGTNDTPADLSFWHTDASIVSGDDIAVISAEGSDSGGSPPYQGAKITFDADANWDTGTSNYYPTNINFFTQDNSGTDTIAAGSRLTIQSDGKVGIGGSPDTLLNLKDTGGIEVRLEADSNNNGQEDCFIRFYTDGKTQEGIAGMDNNNSSTLFSGNTENAMVFGTVSNLPTLFATNNTQRMIIGADGDVHIGDSGSYTGMFTVNDTTASSNKIIAHFQGQGNGADTTTGGQYISVNRTGPISSASNSVQGGLILGSNSTSGPSCMIQSIYQYNNGRDMRFLTTHDNSSDPSIRMVLTGAGQLCVGYTDAKDGAYLSVVSNGGEGIFNGVESTNAYRRYYHTVSDGIHRFKGSANTPTITNGGAWQDASDVAYKEDIQDISYGLDAVKTLRPRTYKMKGTDLGDGKGLDQKIGFIAQEAELVVPEVVDGEDGEKTMSYGQLTAVLTKAIQEQQTIIEAQTTSINDLKTRIEALES